MVALGERLGESLVRGSVVWLVGELGRLGLTTTPAKPERGSDGQHLSCEFSHINREVCRERLWRKVDLDAPGLDPTRCDEGPQQF